MPKCVVVDPSFDWQGVDRPRIPWSETVLYEAENSRLGGLVVRDEYIYFGSVDEGRLLRRHRLAAPPP